MKRCPECRRDYYDDSLLYCLEDGAALVQGSVPSPDEPATAILSEPPASAGGQFDEPRTAILHETTGPGERATRAQIHETEAGPRGPSGDTSERQSLSAHRAAKPMFAAAAGLILIVCGLLGYRYFNPSEGGRIGSIAVLPFANATGDKEVDFLAEGIAETLINNFTQIPELKVTARSTAFRFRGREGEPQAVGRELAVGSMLTGRVMQRGDQLSVQVDLIKTSDGAQVWGNRYEGKTADLVTIQQRIASDVSSQLKLKLTGAQQQQIARTYTQDSVAYQHYLRGRFYWNKRTGDSLRQARDEFRAAADADPTYALAFVGIADSYLLMPEYAGTQVEEAMPKARAFAERALQLDSSLGEPHATLGLINYYAWQWSDADAEFQKAIQVNPNYPTAHHWFSNTLRERGDYKKALAEIRRAQELDPLSGIINVNLGILLALNNDIPAARAQFARTIELDRNWFNGYFWMGVLDVMDGRVDASIPNLQKSVELNREAVRPLGMLGYSLAVAGRRDEAAELVKELEARYAEDVAAASNVATIYFGLGEKAKGYDWLEKGFQDKDIEISRSDWYPQFNSVRQEQRFKDLMQRINKPRIP